MTAMFIDGVAFNGYRSFGKEVQKIGPLSKLNFFIGQNNSGKSNILLWMSEQYGPLVKAIKARNTFEYHGINKHLGLEKNTPDFQLGIIPSKDNISQIVKHFNSNSVSADFVASKVEIILKSEALFSDGISWIPFVIHESNLFFVPNKTLPRRLVEENVISPEEWRTLWYALSGSSGGEMEAYWIPEILKTITQEFLSEHAIHLTPAIRKVGDPGSIISGLSGQGIIDQLATLQNPVLPEIHKKKQFRQINSLLQDVCGNSTITLDIPHDRKSILVHMDDRILPLSSLGTGIHEVVILAAAATLIEDSVLCIEEPELHLHPTLQRKLVRYLRDKTSNQYFITTHSAHLMDTAGASIFHVKHISGCSTVSLLNSPSEKSAVCCDLGYAASDLLQSNCVIWVEGPSDRIYVKHWISSIAPNLQEGLQYSIMFYGGRLLSHLTATDPEVNEFISLRRLNRNMVILMDSDKTSPRAQINSTKRRIRAEFENNEGIAWVTKGREIENYLPIETLENAIKAVYPKATKLKNKGAFDHVLHYRNGRKTITTVDKIKVAREIANHPANLDILDLRAQVSALVKFIHKANQDSEHSSPLPS